jgi:hypothetical protein
MRFPKSRSVRDLGTDAARPVVAGVAALGCRQRVEEEMTPWIS